MAITEHELEKARARMQAHRRAGYAVSARYDQGGERLIIGLDSGVEIAVPIALLEGLDDASPTNLAEIEISPAGLGLHWPRLDADVHVPSLLQGIFGSNSWMARQLGASGGKARSPAKASASRENGKKGGRPRQTAKA